MSDPAQKGLRVAPLPPYPKYRDTGIPWLVQVPAHWDVLRSQWLFSKVTERAPTGDEELLTVSHITGVTPRSEKNVNMFLAESTEGHKLCEEHDLVINTLWTWMGALGVAPCKGVVSPAYNVFRQRQPWRFLPAYLDYLVRIPPYVAYYRSWSKGIWWSRLSLYPDAFGMIRYVVPPLAEQHAIAAFLDRETAKIDQMIAKKERLIELLEEKRTALISQAVTRGLDPSVPMKDSGVEWLGEIPAHWQTTRLKHGTSHIVDCLHATPDYREDGEYPAIRTADVQAGRLHFEQAKRVRHDEYLVQIQRLKPATDDVLYTREGERYGLAALVPPAVDLCISQRMMIFRPKASFVSAYLMYQLNSASVYRQAEQDVFGSTSPHVNIATIRNFRLAQPPIAEQHAIAQHIRLAAAAIDSCTSKVCEAITLLSEQRTALITAAVTGQIDVTTEVDPPDDWQREGA